jgi:DNA-binding transcriptional regulator PaaX
LRFYQLQKSVFVLPYECRDEIEFLIEFYDIRSYVRQIVAEKIDNELHLKEIFKI